jgi:hypothetical protein
MMTKIGFFSIVEKPKGQICIRARKRQDLVNLRKLIPIGAIFMTKMADYRFRCFMNKKEFLQHFYQFATLVDYSNFKDEVKKTNPKREQLYHKVWAQLLHIEEE